MKRGKYEAPRMPKRRNSKKGLAMLLSLVLVFGCVVGGTLAWLTAQDTPVVNKFSPSTIGVELKEHTYNATTDALTDETTETGVTNYKMIPGWTIPKDPQAWITSGSEAAYLFVEIKESANFDTFMTYAIANGWTLLNSNPAQEGSGIVTDDSVEDTFVIYREVAAGATATAMDQDNAFQILAKDQVTVLDTVKKEDMPAAGYEPTLTFTAYAHQLYKANGEKFDASIAWNNLKPNN